ncbi:DUF4838 domain-containing protein [Gemmatirosa kalamazoonensis]|uniref:DUF4838 domain-containing protein n=1 Tax=Gemmatirosa kalamazoonensis TaxID=861299 RepID=UPI0004B363BC|nr:DUF4838 domain-containing protein [Gemmatirosa kalamazoonensis]
MNNDRLGVVVHILSILFILSTLPSQEALAQRPVPIAGRAIVVSDTAAPVRLAASELSTYLSRMTGGAHPVVRDARGPVIALRRLPNDSAVAGDAYAIRVRRDSIILASATPRGVLFAAYDLLERLGCAWLAPELAFYHGAAEVVPRVERLAYAGPADVVVRPAFTRRALEVEEGLSHDSESLAAIARWMPKARLNTLVVPLDYGGSGRVRWDAWRAALTPELVRRGVTIEVGGHGWQNFLSPTDDALFAAHPEWFGKDAACRPSRDPSVVFDTRNADAVRHVVDAVVAYLDARPEIDVFDFWPPDGAKWAECAAERTALGTPADRQAALANAVQAALAGRGSRVRLEVIAYASAKEPPTGVMLDPRILVDFCPIGQNFDVQIDDPRGANNRQYVEALGRWRAAFAGDVAIYSYYRKYAWMSLPVILPHYLQHDLRWYAGQSLRGITTYAEPGDWATYEPNHWMLAHLAWDPTLAADSLLKRYVAARYGAAGPAALNAIVALEGTVRVAGTVPYSAPPTRERVNDARSRLAAAESALGTARGDTAAIARLRLMLDYARRDLDVQAARVAGDSAAARAAVERVADLYLANGGRGVFLHTGRSDRARVLRHYGTRE